MQALGARRKLIAACTVGLALVPQVSVAADPSSSTGTATGQGVAYVGTHHDFCDQDGSDWISGNGLHRDGGADRYYAMGWSPVVAGFGGIENTTPGAAGVFGDLSICGRITGTGLIFNGPGCALLTSEAPFVGVPVHDHSGVDGRGQLRLDDFHVIQITEFGWPAAVGQTLPVIGRWEVIEPAGSPLLGHTGTLAGLMIWQGASPCNNPPWGASTWLVTGGLEFLPDA